MNIALTILCSLVISSESIRLKQSGYRSNSQDIEISDRTPPATTTSRPMPEWKPGSCSTRPLGITWNGDPPEGECWCNYMCYRCTYPAEYFNPNSWAVGVEECLKFYNCCQDMPQHAKEEEKKFTKPCLAQFASPPGEDPWVWDSTAEGRVYEQWTNATICRVKSKASAHEDPHLENVLGQKFDIFKEGVADLIKVPKEAAKDLKIRAAFNRVQRACTSIYITGLKFSGLFLKQNITIDTVHTGNTDRPQDLSVVTNGQELWPFQNITNSDVLITTKHGKESYDEQGIYMKVQKLDIRVTQRVPKQGKGSWSYLNFDVKGLNQLASVGGLLGTDDHSAWVGEPAKCKKKKAFGVQNGASIPSSENGSFATAS